jgi:hypothetical protein
MKTRKDDELSREAGPVKTAPEQQIELPLVLPTPTQKPPSRDPEGDEVWWSDDQDHWFSDNCRWYCRRPRRNGSRTTASTGGAESSKNERAKVRAPRA